MNRQRLNELADLIERTEHFDGNYPEEDARNLLLFNMQSYKENVYSYKGEHCGTVGCIGGLTVYKYDNNAWLKRPFSFHSYARELLDLTRAQAEELFCPDVETPYSEITPQVTAAVIRKMAASEDDNALPEWPYEYTEYPPR